jgi:hypothetical protein
MSCPDHWLRRVSVGSRPGVAAEGDAGADVASQHAIYSGVLPLSCRRTGGNTLALAAIRAAAGGVTNPAGSDTLGP